MTKYIKNELIYQKQKMIKEYERIKKKELVDKKLAA